MYINNSQSLDHYFAGYSKNFGETYYKIEDLVKAIVSECFDVVKSIGINLGSIVETVAENLAAKLVSKGIKNIDDLKGVSNTYQLAEVLTNEIFDYLTDVVHVFSPWAGEGDEPAFWWNSSSNEGSVIVETARGLILNKINDLINKAISSSGLDVHQSSDDQQIIESGKTEDNVIQVVPGMMEFGTQPKAKSGPEYKGNISTSQKSTGTGTVLPIAIGGAALLYFLI